MPTTKPRERARGRLLCLALLALLAAACSSSKNTSAQSTSPSPSSVVASGAVAQAVQDTFVSVVEKVRPSVVEIATDSGLGSGVAYDPAGNIVTNAHVVGTATSFRITLSDGHIQNAELVGIYPPDDLAVVRLTGGEVPSPLALADSSRVRVGDMSFAVGNPLGLVSSVTQGIVSSTGRTVGEGNGVVLRATIQTSAPINPGNSGGALVNLDGQLIGIPTLTAINPQLGSVAPGIGFAIASNTVKLIADQLIRDGKVTNSGRAVLGISASAAVDSSGSAIGVLVRDVKPSSGAANAGIMPGDIITMVDGKPVTDANTLADVLAQHNPGDRVSVEVTHQDGKRETVEVVLGELTT